MTTHETRLEQGKIGRGAVDLVLHHLAWLGDVDVAPHDGDISDQLGDAALHYEGRIVHKARLVDHG